MVREAEEGDFILEKISFRSSFTLEVLDEYYLFSYYYYFILLLLTLLLTLILLLLLLLMFFLLDSISLSIFSKSNFL